MRWYYTMRRLKSYDYDWIELESLIERVKECYPCCGCGNCQTLEEFENELRNGWLYGKDKFIYRYRKR